MTGGLLVVRDKFYILRDIAKRLAVIQVLVDIIA